MAACSESFSRILSSVTLWYRHLMRAMVQESTLSFWISDGISHRRSAFLTPSMRHPMPSVVSVRVALHKQNVASIDVPNS